jgi:hypothetical protein
LGRWDGEQQCLYDAVRYVSAECPEPHADGPHSAREFNTGGIHASQRDSQVHWLEEIAGASPKEVLSRYIDFICWQPYEDTFGHYFAAKVLDNNCVAVSDSSVGVVVHTAAHNFVMALNRVGTCYFFKVGTADATAPPSMTSDAYDLAGGGERPTKSARCFPLPKRGKRRMFARTLKIKKKVKQQTKYGRKQTKGNQLKANPTIKKLGKNIKQWRALWRNTPYVRHYDIDVVKRPERVAWPNNLNTLRTLTAKQLIQKLTKEGFLKDWTKTTCPHCNRGNVCNLRQRNGCDTWEYRCGSCDIRISPHHSHPIFSNAWGKNFVSLKDQTEILFCLTLGTPLVQVRRLLGHSEDFVQRLSQRLDLCRKKYVVTMQKNITYGFANPLNYADVEADEVDLGKALDDAGTGMRWAQWAGIVQRGFPRSLFLFKTKPKLTKVKSPGPGPIKKKDWEPVARKMLQSRYVFLHTDGARSYRLSRKIHGIVHDFVVHKPKKIRGKWVKPKYTQLFVHKMPEGKQVATKGGTQIIDRCWSTLRKHLGKRSKNPGNAAVESRVRSAQWVYWHRDKDLWLATGELCRWLL